MSIGQTLGNIAGAGGTLEINISKFSASRFSLFITGTIGGGVLAVNGGVQGNVQPVMITDPTVAGFSALSMSSAGLFTFDACCTYLTFVLSGAAGADIDLVLYPEPRH